MEGHEIVRAVAFSIYNSDNMWDIQLQKAMKISELASEFIQLVYEYDLNFWSRFLTYINNNIYNYKQYRHSPSLPPKCI